MPRRALIAVAGVPWHIIQRGNNRSACFYTESDKLYFLSTLAEQSLKWRCEVHAYVLMTNHFHLLLTSRYRESAADMMCVRTQQQASCAGDAGWQGKGSKTKSPHGPQNRTPFEQRAAISRAQRLQRVFNRETVICRKCGGTVKVIACIEGPGVIRKILTHLKEKTTAIVAMLPYISYKLDYLPATPLEQPPAWLFSATVMTKPGSSRSTR